MKKKNNEEKINNTCDCEECHDSCECGCEDNHSEHIEENECTHDCSCCCGCENEMDPNMIIELLSEKTRQLEDKNMRLQAEYLNYKTRTSNEIARMFKYEGEEFIKELLVIKDNLERAILLDDNDLSDEVSKFLSGIKLILGNLTTLFDKFEIKEIDALGKEFDPMLMEAVITEQNKEKLENVVLEIYTKGYTYKDKLIRPAMVKVNK